jgi:Zn-dependent M16 (insulinase) family peptidase
VYGKFSVLAVALWVALMPSSQASPANLWDTLQPEDVRAGFQVHSVYEGAGGEGMGGRFVSEKHGFIVDLLTIESVPQAFVWIKTPTFTDKGEPHTCEHLLLGKGNRGRYVAALEDMALASSSAYTGRLRTCYHFNTIAGTETFYRVLEAKLMAFLCPDFTDEEIRREVCHMGIEADPVTGRMSLEEKGTVYTEMVSSFEKPWYYHSSELRHLLYGEGHPISNISGGTPAGLRTFTPDDLWRFHERTHHLANMGIIVALPSSCAADSFLERMAGILDRCQPSPSEGVGIGIGAYDLPEPNPGPTGAVRIVGYPSEDPEDPGSVHVVWPAHIELDDFQEFLLKLFVTTFCDGHTSNLYDLFINSSTRTTDIGVRNAWGWVSGYPGHPVWMGLDGVKVSYVTESMVDSVRSLIVGEIRRIHDLDDGSEEVVAFNREVDSRLQRGHKERVERLNAPPMFGFRSGSAGWWVSTLETLEKTQGFRKSLLFADHFARIQRSLASGRNIWRELIDSCRLLEAAPYAVGSAPDLALLAGEREAKSERLADYVVSLRQEYSVADDQEAIARYKEDFDRRTAELDSIAGEQDLPGFVDDPPMTLDDRLNHTVEELPGDVPLVASTFEQMTTSTVGIALRLDVIPESLLVYVPYLTDVLTSIGVVEDGVVVPYDAMEERLRREVLSFDARFDYGQDGARIELMLEGGAGDADELRNVLHWMALSLYAPYLDTDNLFRMTDLVDQRLLQLQKRQKGSEESWVDDPARAFRYQSNPLFLATHSFLTHAHQLRRLRFLLTDAGSPLERQALDGLLDQMDSRGRGATRQEIAEELEELRAASRGLPGHTPEVAEALVDVLRAALVEIPDGCLETDWGQLRDQLRTDLMRNPSEALRDLRQALTLITRADNARMYLVSNTADRQATQSAVERFAARLDSEHPSRRQDYPPTRTIVERLRQRVPEVDEPLFVGLVNEGTRNGVLIHAARFAAEYDTSTSAVLDCLAGNLFTGGGAHSLFMRTWGAGLAYSNGFGVDEARGTVSYYAERCPDVAETMAFVVGELADAAYTPALLDYAVAQIFRPSRAASRYESRGRGMAADLADGLTPERVAAFRGRVLELRGSEGLYDELLARLGGIYGRVLIGYGVPVSESEERSFFLIGPESQFSSFERYIEETEGLQTVHRLYPRDFWLTP